MLRAPRVKTVIAHGPIAWREAGTGPALVLLHGIGSGAPSWQGQLDGLAASYRVVAWDAPGYGESAPLAQAQPLAQDYADALAEFLARLGIDELTLVGHSLGAMTAAAWAARPTARLHGLVLASPARGYGDTAPALRLSKWQERVKAVADLGPAGLAAQRAAGLCVPGAAPEVVDAVRRNMERITVAGYSQAAHMLAYDRLLDHLTQVVAPVAVLCGELDRVTPPDACAEVAAAVGAPFTRLPGVAHACYVENPTSFNAALIQAIDAFQVPPP